MKTIKQVLYILVAMMLIGAVAGCSHSGKQTMTEKQKKTYNEIQSATLKMISDPARRQQVMTLVDQVKLDTAQYEKDRIVFLRELNALDVNYDSTDKDYQTLFASQDAKLDEFQKSAVSIHQKIMKLLTKEEYDNLKDVRDDAIAAYITSIQ